MPRDGGCEGPNLGRCGCDQEFWMESFLCREFFMICTTQTLWRDWQISVVRRRVGWPDSEIFWAHCEILWDVVPLVSWARMQDALNMLACLQHLLTRSGDCTKANLGYAQFDHVWPTCATESMLFLKHIGAKMYIHWLHRLTVVVTRGHLHPMSRCVLSGANRLHGDNAAAFC